MCMSVYHMCAFCLWRSEDTLTLKLQMVVNHFVDPAYVSPASCLCRPPLSMTEFVLDI